MKKRKASDVVATVIYYGPTDQFATKVVASIVTGGKDNQVVAMQKWINTIQDVRYDSTVSGEILAFVEKYKPKRVLVADRILGCPHQEGIDYPEGTDCPYCPFWAGRDRFTGELKK